MTSSDSSSPAGSHLNRTYRVPGGSGPPTSSSSDPSADPPATSVPATTSVPANTNAPTHFSPPRRRRYSGFVSWLVKRSLFIS